MSKNLPSDPIHNSSTHELTPGRTPNATKLRPVRATRDVIGGDRDDEKQLIDRIPPERFGCEKARILRKLVLIAIAKSSDADGSNAYPSLETIAHRSLVSERAVRTTIAWLVDHILLAVEPYAGAHHTNRYSIIFPEPSEANPAIELPGLIERGEGNPEEWSGQPGRMEAQPGNRTSDNRPLDRPSLTGRSARKGSSHSTGVKSLASSVGKKKKSQGTPDPRFKPCHDYAYEGFQEKFGQTPTWRGKHMGQLAGLLKKKRDLTLEEFRRRWTHYVASTEPFTVGKKLSLAHFCANFDEFIDGPKFDRSNGKVRSVNPMSGGKDAGKFSDIPTN